MANKLTSNSIHETFELLSKTSIDPLLLQFLTSIKNELEDKDKKINELECEVKYLSKKVNEIERYSSKDCIIIKNLPNKGNLLQDILYFFNDVMGVEVYAQDLKAFHPLGKPGEGKTPNVIVKFIYFGLKDRIWARKYMLKNTKKPHNGYPIYLFERLTKSDADLLNYANNLGLKTTTYNSTPQLLVKTGSGVRFHNIVDVKDVDELFASGKAIPKKQSELATASRVKRVRELSTPKRDENLLNKLKSLRNNPDELKEFIDGLQDGSPPTSKLYDNDGSKIDTILNLNDKPVSK